MVDEIPDLRFGFPEFHEPHSELNCDVLWVFNILYDGG